MLRFIVVGDNKGKALPRLVSAIWFSLGWCIVQQGDRQRGFTNPLGDGCSRASKKGKHETPIGENMKPETNTFEYDVMCSTMERSEGS